MSILRRESLDVVLTSRNYYYVLVLALWIGCYCHIYPQKIGHCLRFLPSLIFFFLSFWAQTSSQSFSISILYMFVLFCFYSVAVQLTTSCSARVEKALTNHSILPSLSLFLLTTTTSNYHHLRIPPFTSLLFILNCHRFPKEFYYSPPPAPPFSARMDSWP